MLLVIMKKIHYLAFSFLSLVMANSSQAVVFSWTGTSNISGQTLTASADFTAVGNVLTIKLSNDSLQASNNPADTLGTLFWDMPTTFLAGNATNNASQGASVVEQNNVAYTGAYDLNKEYMYNDGLVFQSVNFDHGVSSVGLGAGGFATNNDTFYERMKGLGNAGSTPADAFSMASAFGTSGAANNIPVVRNAMTFTLTSASAIDLASIHDVNFSFGSGGQTNSVVPEPGSIAAICVGLISLARRRKRAC